MPPRLGFAAALSEENGTSVGRSHGTPSTDDDYVLQVRDHLRAGGPEYVYRVEIAPVEPKLTMTLPERRQNLLFSATMPDEIRRLTRDLLARPHVVELAIAKPAETIDHSIIPVVKEYRHAGVAQPP